MKMNAEDLNRLWDYIERIMAMITMVRNLTNLNDAALKISSHCVCSRMSFFVASSTIPSHLTQLRLAATFLRHTHLLEILAPEVKWFDHLQIKPENLTESIEQLMQTPINITVPSKGTGGKSSAIIYKDLLEQKYDDTFLLAWASESGEQHKTSTENKSRQTEIVNNLLVELQLNDFKKTPPNDYITLKFYLLSQLLAYLASSIKQIIEFLYHHYRTACLLYARSVTNQVSFNEDFLRLKNKMSELNDQINSLWITFPEIKSKIVVGPDKDIYHRYSHDNHKVVLDRNKEVFNIIDIVQRTSLHFLELQSMAMTFMHLARNNANEAANLLALIYNFSSSLNQISNQAMIPTSAVSTSILDTIKQIDESLKHTDSSKPTTTAQQLSLGGVFSASSPGRKGPAYRSPQPARRPFIAQTDKQRGNPIEGDIQNLMNYMGSISQLSDSCIAIKSHFLILTQYNSSMISRRLQEKIGCDKQEKDPIGLQVELQQHAKNATIINSNIYFCDLPLEIDAQKFQNYLAKIFATPMAPHSSTKLYTESSLNMTISYKELYDGNYQDLQLILMLNTLGDPDKVGGFGRHQFEAVIAQLLKYLELNGCDEDKKLDYPALKFYLIQDLLIQLVTIIKTTAEYILHHYQITCLWFQMLTHLFNQTPRNNTATINTAIKKAFMDEMTVLTTNNDKFWQAFPALQFLATNVEVKKIYDTYTYKKHNMLEGKNDGLREKLLIVESVLQIITQWQIRFEKYAELIPKESDLEATSLMLLLVSIKTNIKNYILFLSTKINNSSTLIVKKLEDLNREVNLEIEEAANKHPSLPTALLLQKEKVHLTHGRSKSFSH